MARYFLPGRWQPLHEGHVALIESLLAQGHEVVVGIRDTRFGLDNPYSPWERREMFYSVFGERVRAVVIPDFDVIGYGRKVGWVTEELSLPESVQRVSATEKRSGRGKVIWLTGNSGAGKTTLANELCQRMRAIKLDGNEMRSSISVGAGFSEDERLIHNLRVARLAEKLSAQMDVIVAVIAPTERIRKAVEEVLGPIWVYVRRTMPEREGYFYTPPTKPDLVVDHDSLAPSESARVVMSFLRSRDAVKVGSVVTA